MMIKSGLGSDDIHNLTPLDVEGAKRLQQMSARYQAAQTRPIPGRMTRSKSDAGVVNRADLKVGLEQIIKM